MTVTEIDLDSAIWNIDFKIRCSNTRATFVNHPTPSLMLCLATEAERKESIRIYLFDTEYSKTSGI